MAEDPSQDDPFAEFAYRTKDDGVAVATPYDRAFFFKTLSALATAGVPFFDCLGRIRDGLSGAIEDDAHARRRANLAKCLVAYESKAGTPLNPFLFEVFENNGFLLSAMERCALSIKLSEATPLALTAVAAAAAGFSMEIKSR